MVDFSVRANRGEWSELYALFRLLGDGKLVAGDENHTKIDNLVYPIVEIVRMDSGRLFNYKNTGDVVLITENKKELARVKVSEFTRFADFLLSKIQEAKDATFEIKDIEQFRKNIYTFKIKAESQEKADIYIVIHDPITNLSPKLGFSIKSELGAVPTLFNSGKISNFIFKLTNPLDEELINLVNETKGFKEKIQLIKGKCDLKFEGIQSGKDGNLLYNNLVLMDSCMPVLLANLLVLQYTNEKGTKSVAELVKIITEENPLGFDMSSNHPFYESKVKHLLVDSALGMTAGKRWDGVYQANGGYLVVRKSGEIVCYHIYNKKEFEDYLFYNTKFETPSTSKYDFGRVEKRGDGSQYFKLNLQIRFTK